MDDIRDRSVDEDIFPVVEDDIVPASGDDTPPAWWRWVIDLSFPAALGIGYFLIYTAISRGGTQPLTVMEALGIFLVLMVGLFAALIIGKPASLGGESPVMDDAFPAMGDATDGAVVDDPYRAPRRLAAYWGLAVNKLKIDLSFVRNVTDDPANAAITKTIIALAKNLNLGVIAEGVETAEQLAFLRHHECEEVQGYFISRPLPGDQFTVWYGERLQNLAREGRGG